MYKRWYWIWSLLVFLLVCIIMYFSNIQSETTPQWWLSYLGEPLLHFSFVYFIFDTPLVRGIYCSWIIEKLKPLNPALNNLKEDYRSWANKNLKRFFKIIMIPFLAIFIVYLWTYFTQYNDLKVYPAQLFKISWNIGILCVITIGKMKDNLMMGKIDQLLLVQKEESQ